MKHIAPLLFLCLLPISCVSSRSVRITSSDTLLASKPLVEGGTTTWRLHASGADRPTLDRTNELSRDIAYLGLKVRTLDESGAARLGVAPWVGVRITSVTRNGAAEQAGLRNDDVLISIGDQMLSSEEQFTGIVRSKLVPGEAVDAIISRKSGKNEVSTLELRIVPEAKEVTDSATESTELESSAMVRSLTGLQAAEIPSDLAKEMFGDEATKVFVATVGVGTPAYMSGLRAGDRILKVDGKDVTDLDDVRGAVYGRARERNIALGNGSEVMIETPRGVDGPLEFQVLGPLGTHTASFDVRADLGEYGSIDIPILFECESSASSTDWSFLDFIFQFGANYRGHYLASSTRRPARSTFFSMLPFGFFEVEKHPGYARYCVLWFIEWETFK